MILLKSEKKLSKEVKELYLSAFPKEERKTFNFLEKLIKEEKAIIHTAIKDGVLAGFAIILTDNDYALIDYFAVNESLRGLGIGSQILEELKTIYKNKCLFLERETVLRNCDNAEQRNRRRHFYLKNGFSDSGIYVNVYTVDMTIMTYENKISFSEYSNFLKKILGEKIFNKIKVQTSTFSDETI